MKQFINYVMFVSCFLFTLLVVVSSTLNVKAEDVYPFKGAITSATLVVHDKPNTLSSSSVTEIAYGTVVDVLEKVKDKNIYKIKYNLDKEGYVASKYVVDLKANTLTESVEGVETYENYCNTLVTKGFDKSYCPYLYYLHVKYPNWTFTADKIGVTLKDASVSQEGTGTLETDNKNYWIDTTPAEGSYYYVNSTVIAAIMDPRNSLFEDRIFQFLDVQESKDIYNDVALNKISTQGNLALFINNFKNVATLYGITPVHLMARSRQEGADKAGFSGTTGLYTTNTKTDTYAGHTSEQGYSLDGYYNFYNIGAYKSGYYQYTVQRGLAYAAGFLQDDMCISMDENGKPYYDETKCEKLTYQRPWTTPEKAVEGGADFLNLKYISKGQDNLYFQKFNVSSYRVGTMHTNQYMTNLGAPVNEALIMYSAYNAGDLLNSNFNFVIPVYENMPETVYQPVNKSTNSKLNDITINDKKFNEFDSDVVEYNYNLVTTEDTFKVDAKADDVFSTIEGIGDYTFVDGAAQVKIVVTAEAGNVTTYLINVTKVVPEEVVTVNDIISKMGIKVSDNVIYGISPDTVVSTLVNTVTKNKGEAKVTDANGQVKATGSYVTGDKITIIGTNEEVTYTIAVRGDINGDGVVNLKDFVLIQSHILEKKIMTDINFYAGDVNYDGKIVLSDFVLVQSHILGKKYL